MAMIRFDVRNMDLKVVNKVFKKIERSGYTCKDFTSSETCSKCPFSIEEYSCMAIEYNLHGLTNDSTYNTQILVGWLKDQIATQEFIDEEFTGQIESREENT